MAVTLAEAQDLESIARMVLVQKVNVHEAKDATAAEVSCRIQSLEADPLPMGSESLRSCLPLPLSSLAIEANK